MLRPLRPETIHAAKQASRRATVALTALLLAIYVVLFDLAYLSVHFVLWVGAVLFRVATRGEEQLRDDAVLPAFPTLGEGLLVATTLSLLAAGAHYLWARRRSLAKMLADVGAADAARDDSYHARFRNIVEEAEIATRLRGIRAVILPTTGYNAFALAGPHGEMAIGITEGFLGRLRRSEVSAVVAQCAAHLAAGDVRLASLAASFVGIFDAVQSALARRVGGERRRKREDDPPSVTFAPFQFLLWALGFLGYTATYLASVAISRERKLLADAHAVQMSSEPLALAESLHIASQGFRGRSGVPRRYGALFLLSPEHFRLDAKSGLAARLFSTHPPLRERLQRLLAWARADLETLRGHGGPLPATPSAPRKREPRFRVRDDSSWSAPLPLSVLLSRPDLAATTWVARLGSNEILRAGSCPELAERFGAVEEPAAICPRCETGLIATRYEGAPLHECPRGCGRLLGDGVLERVIARREQRFDAEDIAKATAWRALQEGTLHESCEFPPIRCPGCRAPMRKSYHSYLTRVVLDRCVSPRCASVWLDSEELERIQLLVENEDPGSRDALRSRSRVAQDDLV